MLRYNITIRLTLEVGFFNNRRVIVEDKNEKEVKKQMLKDEAEIESLINKHGTIETGNGFEVEEEDEETETFSLSFNEEGKPFFKQYESEFYLKKGNEEQEKKIEHAEIESQVIHSSRSEYDNMIHDVLVSKIIGKMIMEMKKKTEEAVKIFEDAHLGSVGENMTKTIEDESNKKIAELRSSIRSGKVYYEDIPDYAKIYVQEHIRNAMNSLFELSDY